MMRYVEPVQLDTDVPGVVGRRGFLGLLGAGAATLALPGNARGMEFETRNDVPDWVFEDPPVVLDQDPARALLDQNENQLAPSEVERKALIAALDLANRYPDGEGALVRKIAAHHGVEREQVLMGCGSTELLKVCADAVMGPGRELVQSTPTYPTIERYTRVRGGEVVSIPVPGHGSLDLEEMLASVGRRTAAFYVCNPNNPTGGISDDRALRAAIEALPAGVLAVVDEAYHDYVVHPDYRTLIPVAVRRPDVVVLRTFSKVYGLAGMRIGYAIASAETVERLAPHRLSLDLNNPAIYAAGAALDDRAFYDQTVRMNNASRAAIMAELPRFGGRPVPSQGGFVWIDFGRPTRAIRDGLAEQHVYVRTYGHSPNHLRISTGTETDMERLFAALGKVTGVG